MFILTKQFPFVKIVPVFKTHFDAFLAYADQQVITRKIDHQDWCACAVGTYSREAQSIPPKDKSGQEVPVDFNRGVSPLLKELADDHSFIFNCLNRGRLPSILTETSEFEIKTYCGLATFMTKYRGMSYDDFSSKAPEGF